MCPQEPIRWSDKQKVTAKTAKHNAQGVGRPTRAGAHPKPVLAHKSKAVVETPKGSTDISNPTNDIEIDLLLQDQSIEMTEDNAAKGSSGRELKKLYSQKVRAVSFRFHQGM